MEQEPIPKIRPDVDPSPWMNDRLAEETMSDIVDYYTHVGCGLCKFLISPALSSPY